MNPASNRATAHLDTTTRPARDSLSPEPPGEDSLSPRPGSGERAWQRGFQKRATNLWNDPLAPRSESEWQTSAAVRLSRCARSIRGDSRNSRKDALTPPKFELSQVVTLRSYRLMKPNARMNIASDVSASIREIRVKESPGRTFLRELR